MIVRIEAFSRRIIPPFPSALGTIGDPGKDMTSPKSGQIESDFKEE